MDRPLNLNQAVENLQRYLRKISFYEPSVTRPPIDGIFDSDTLQAVKDYQALRGAEPDGIVDKATWDSIFEEYTALLRSESIGEGIELFFRRPTAYHLRRGDEGSLVSILQLLLIELSVIYDELEAVTESGVFDEITENAVKSFQRANLLPDSGLVETATWNALLKAYAEIADNYS